MLNSNIIQNNIAALQPAAEETDKLKREGSKQQEATQRKIDEITTRQATTVSVVAQDTNPQKILDEEESNEQKNTHAKSKQKKDDTGREVFRDTNKGNIVDIFC